MRRVVSGIVIDKTSGLVYTEFNGNDWTSKSFECPKRAWESVSRVATID